MTRAIALATLVVLGCSPPSRLSAIRFAAEAEIGCDYGQTAWAADGDRWDRTYESGGHHYEILESNPLLGRRPPHGERTLAAIGAVTAVELVYRSDGIPTAAKWAVLGAVALGEAYVISTNYAQGGGACGLAGTGR